MSYFDVIKEIWYITLMIQLWGVYYDYLWETGSVLTKQVQMEMHGHVLSNVAADAPMLKHQAISICNADKLFIVLDQFHTEIHQL